MNPDGKIFLKDKNIYLKNYEIKKMITLKNKEKTWYLNRKFQKIYVNTIKFL